VEFHPACREVQRRIDGIFRADLLCSQEWRPHFVIPQRPVGPAVVTTRVSEGHKFNCMWEQICIQRYSV
jgi:hypothetical protein